ncbi:MAG: hypothetical protein U1E36_05125 [Rickettsiales bacterium]
MQLYLPIAEMSVDALGINLLGGEMRRFARRTVRREAASFLLTPLLIFIGIPPRSPLPVREPDDRLLTIGFHRWRRMAT